MFVSKKISNNAVTSSTRTMSTIEINDITELFELFLGDQDQAICSPSSALPTELTANQLATLPIGGSRNPKGGGKGVRKN